jgi:4-hydroxybenzoate polyprenyltransferase
MEIPIVNHISTHETKLSGIIRLSRWREHVPFTIPLTLAGGLLATEAIQTAVDWRLFAIILANILAMSFAFMINDVEDAPDDALNPKKKMHNVISSGILTRREGWVVTWMTGAISFVLYSISGVSTLILGGVMLVLCYLYSAHPFRLKARPLTDVVSHVLMLSGLLIMTGYFAYDADPQIAWLVIIAAILVSAYGQFYNQIDDYEVDKAAGLKNTVVLLGKTPTLILSYVSLVGAVICMGIAVLQGLFPDWLGTIFIISIVTTIIFPWEFDMRGNHASDGGNIQRPALVVANMITIAWLASSMGFLIIV